MEEKKSIKNGIFPETNKEYHSYLEAISKSRLSKMSVCPKYFKWCEDNQQKPTEDLIFGQAFHKYVLEQETFGVEFVVMPQIDKRTKEGKEIYNHFLLATGERTIITQEQFDIILAMKDSLMQNPIAKKLIETSAHEKSFYEEDELTKEQIKARPDCFLFNGDRLVIVDLKTCKSPITEDFKYDVKKYFYDLQAYMYSYIASKVLDLPIKNIDFYFIAIQKTPPYLINILKADKDVLDRGEMLYRKFIGEYHHCKQTNNWYDLNGEENLINSLSLPEYLLKGVNDKNE